MAKAKGTHKHAKKKPSLCLFYFSMINNISVSCLLLNDTKRSEIFFEFLILIMDHNRQLQQQVEATKTTKKPHEIHNTEQQKIHVQKKH